MHEYWWRLKWWAKRLFLGKIGEPTRPYRWFVSKIGYKFKPWHYTCTTCCVSVCAYMCQDCRELTCACGNCYCKWKKKRNSPA